MNQNSVEQQGKQPSNAPSPLQSWLRPWSLVIIVALGLVFLHFNSRREFMLTLPNGSSMKVVDSEPLSMALLRQLSPSSTNAVDPEDGEARVRREMLVAALVAVMKSQKSTDQLGKELIKIARAADNPFSWSDRDAKIVYSKIVPINHFRICANDFQDWKGSLARVSVFDPNITDESSVTSEATVDRDFACEKRMLTKDAVMVQTSDRTLFAASQKPGAIAKAVVRVTIPW